MIYTIAEVGSNWYHENKFHAKEEVFNSIRRAADVGADAVKFQIFTADSLYSKERAPKVYETIKRYELPIDWLPDMADYAHDAGVDLWASVFSPHLIEKTVRYLDGIKIASGDITNVDLIKAAAGAAQDLGIPLGFSNGAATPDEVENAFDVIDQYDISELILFHCVSAYPAKAETINLMSSMAWVNIDQLGFSDHTWTDETAQLAAALGYTCFEKHFHTETAGDTPDRVVSIDPDDFRQYIDGIKRAVLIVGGQDRTLTEEEKSERIWARRGPDGLRPAIKVEAK